MCDELAVINGFESVIPALNEHWKRRRRGCHETKKRSALFGNETRDKMSDKIEIRVSN